jgi:hypothetical protein
MAPRFVVRTGWLKLMYLYTVVGAGGFGLGILARPQAMSAALGWPVEEPLAISIAASVYLAFALLSLLGLREPLKFAPVLLLQLGYKTIWLAAVALPLLLAGRLPTYGLITTAIFASYVIGDLIAIPFRYLFARTTA